MKILLRISHLPRSTYYYHLKRDKVDKYGAVRRVTLALCEKGVAQSMSGKGNCFDNAAMESFFGRLKVEMIHGEEFRTVGEFVCGLESYICHWNSGRLSLALAFFMARYITLYIDSSSGKLDLFRVTFRREKFSDSMALVV